MLYIIQIAITNSHPYILQMNQEVKSYDEEGTQVEIGDWQSENDTELVGQEVAEEREFKTSNNICFFLLIILNATKLLIIIQWLLLPQLLSVHFVLLATAATNAAPRPEPSSDNMMSNSLSALTSLCIVSLM